MLLVGSCRPTMVSYNGCTSYWDESSFPIVVSPNSSFTESELAYVAIAAQEWNIAVNAEVFVVKPRSLQDSKPKPLPRPEGIEMGHADLNDTFLGYCPVIYHNTMEGRLGRIWRGACLLDREAIQSNATYTHVVMHELGHGLGFIHDVDPASVMYSRVSSTKKAFTQKHLDTVRAMMKGTYKGKSLGGRTSCL